MSIKIDEIEIIRIVNKRNKKREWFKKARKSGNAKKTYLRATKKYVAKNMHKILAAHGITKRVKRGKMPHPTTLECKNCKNKAIHYHHHLGYDGENRWKVIPLCMNCHMIIHHPPKITSLPQKN